jgi:hypothetical protein
MDDKQTIRPEEMLENYDGPENVVMLTKNVSIVEVLKSPGMITTVRRWFFILAGHQQSNTFCQVRTA